MRIEHWELTDVKPYPGNPRLNDDAVDAVAADSVRNSETWLPVPHFEGLYEVSSLGRVRRSHPSRCIPGGYILAPRNTHDGYVKYSLYKQGRYRHITGHRLVALAFLGPPPFAGAHVAHRDGDRANNRVGNLRWATPTENEADKRKHGTARGAWPGERHHNAKLNVALVKAMRQRAAAGADIASIARQFGVAKITAYDAIVGKTWRIVTDPKPLEPIRRKAS